MRQGSFVQVGARIAKTGWTSRAAKAVLLASSLAASAFAVGGAAGAQTLAALPSISMPLQRSGGAKPVPAWTKFCDRNAAECAVDPSEAGTVALTSDIWQLIVSVNRRVNTRIKPVTDDAHWGVIDRWDLPQDGLGDCEDYQLLKRKILVERGLPRRALRMTVVIDEQNEGHAVLMVRTDRGDFILDNKTSTVLPWEQTGYLFVKREGQDSLAWVSLNGVKSPTTTANR